MRSGPIKEFGLFLAGEGRLEIVKPIPELNRIAENALGESCRALPAISHRKLHIRGDQDW